jgi:hypothetical protein
MAIHKEDLREDLQSGACKECGGPISKDEECMISFYRGEFVLFHNGCFDVFFRRVNSFSTEEK